MNCPTCLNRDLVMSNREGVEIDYCPQCRGVWLDRGELDKIIERSVDTPTQAEMEYGRGDREYSGSDYRRRKPKNPWKEIFDF